LIQTITKSQMLLKSVSIALLRITGEKDLCKETNKNYIFSIYNPLNHILKSEISLFSL